MGKKKLNHFDFGMKSADLLMQWTINLYNFDQRIVME